MAGSRERESAGPATPVPPVSPRGPGLGHPHPHSVRRMMWMPGSVNTGPASSPLSAARRRRFKWLLHLTWGRKQERWRGGVQTRRWDWADGAPTAPPGPSALTHPSCTFRPATAPELGAAGGGKAIRRPQEAEDSMKNEAQGWALCTGRESLAEELVSLAHSPLLAPKHPQPILGPSLML